MATNILVNIASDNGLVPDSTNPLPGPMLPIANEVLWHSSEGNSIGYDQDMSP